MKLQREVYIAGGAHTAYAGKERPEIRQGQGQSLEQLLCEAARSALANSAVPAAEIQKGYVGNFLGQLFAKQGLLGAALAGADPALASKPFLRVEAACASGGMALAQGVDAIQAGWDCVLVAGAEVECNVRGGEAVDFMARACHWERQRDEDAYIFPWLFARRAQHYEEAFGATPDDRARVVAKAYANAARNPLAQSRERGITFEDASTLSEANCYFLSEGPYRESIRMFDCTQFTDGASALVLVSEAARERLGLARDALTRVLSVGQAVNPIGEISDPTRLVTMGQAAQRAYDAAGVAPADIAIAEVHDCFSIAELQAYEALGFSEEGRGYTLLREGHTQIDGRLPVNTGGGLIGFGHPVGATGVKQVLELHRQMQGACGDYQLPSRPPLGIAANIGGDDRTSVVTIVAPA